METWSRIGVRPDWVARRSYIAAAHRVIGVALSWPAVSPGAARGEAEKGFVLLKVPTLSMLTTASSSAKGSADERDHRDGQALGRHRGRRRNAAGRSRPAASATGRAAAPTRDAMSERRSPGDELGQCGAGRFVGR